MTATTVPAVASEHTPVPQVISDAVAVARRNVIGLLRVPTTVVFATIQPVLFVLMFRYVFGGAIRPPSNGVRYVDYLMAGIFVQTVTFGAVNTGVGLAADLQLGLIERFRSLPMARSAVLAGRVLADMLRNLFVIILMVVVGFLVGFRVHTGVVPFLGAVALMLLFGMALSWFMALIGLVTGNPEAAQAAAFPILALVVFASNAFVPTETMPGPLRAYANHQPVSATVSAVRALLNGGATAGHVFSAVAWTLAIAIVFAVLSVARFRRTV